MSETRFQCLSCGKKYKIPSNLTVTDPQCLECGSPMTATATSRSQRPAMVGGPAALFQFAGGPAAAPLSELTALRPLNDPDLPALDSYLHPPPAPDRDHTSMFSGAVFLLVGALMITFQYFAPSLKSYADEYIIARNLLALVASLLMAYSAAQDGIFRGVLCIVFPPYLLLYATSQEESGWLRGLFLGVLLGLCAEAFLIPERSLILQLGPAVNILIERVQGWMQLASRPPV